MNMTKPEDRATRNETIEEMWIDGSKCSEIAESVGLRADMVRKVLKAKGYRLDFRKPGEKPYTVWDMAPRDRRQAFWERAKSGAAQARSASATASFPHNQH